MDDMSGILSKVDGRVLYVFDGLHLVTTVSGDEDMVTATRRMGLGSEQHLKQRAPCTSLNGHNSSGYAAPLFPGK